MKSDKKMEKAMKMMKEACESRDSWTLCSTCPFDKFCTALMDAGLIDPFEGIDWDYAAEDK